MRLFDQIPRCHLGPADHAEDTFSFLNRSALPTVARIRSVIEEWFSHYPNKDKLGLISCFRSHFESTFFELFIHELLILLGSVVVVHPGLPAGVRRRPDYLAVDSHNSRSYVEVVLATDESAEDLARQRVLAVFYDAINKVDIPDFFINVREIQNPRGIQPSAKRFRAFLEEKLKAVDADQAVALAQAGLIDLLPNWTYEEGDFYIELSLIPVSPEARAKSAHRPIGIHPLEWRWGGTNESLRGAIQKKAGRYGRLDAPYVVAVNALSLRGTNRTDIMRALFGEEQFGSSVRSSDNPSLERRPDGMWIGPKGPRNTRLSAVLIATVAPWNLPKAPICLYHNPWAAAPYRGSLVQLPQALASPKGMVWKEGIGLGELFNLPPSWPGRLLDDT